MRISLNGTMPTKHDLEVLSEVVPTSFTLGGFSEYEENCEWNHMVITYPNGDVLESQGYTGLWKLVTLETQWAKLTDDVKVDILGDLFEFFGWYYDNDPEDIELFSSK